MQTMQAAMLVSLTNVQKFLDTHAAKLMSPISRVVTVCTRAPIGPKRDPAWRQRRTPTRRLVATS
jgi:hypothetical protein